MNPVDLRDQLAAHLHQLQETRLAQFDAYVAGDFEMAQRMTRRVEHHQARVVDLAHRIRCHAITFGRKGHVFERPETTEAAHSADPLRGDFH